MSDDEPEGATPAAKVARLHPPGVPHHVTLDRAVQGAIGAELRRMYDQLVEQPIPDRLLDLVNRIADLHPESNPAPVRREASDAD